MGDNGAGPARAPVKQRTPEQMVEYWQKNYYSMADAVEKLVASGLSKDKRIQQLEANLTNCQTNLDAQKQIVRDAIGQDNDVKQANAAEIGRLRGKVEALGGNLD